MARDSYRGACPFCGSSRAHEDVVLNTGGNRTYFRCQDCHAQGPWSTRSAGPLELWNKRPSGPSGGNKLQVWWIPQVPGKPFTVPVASVQEAKKLLDVLALYDIFQYENRIKPDYANAGGLSVFEDGEWTDWYDEEGNDVDSSPLATTGGNK